MKNTKTCPKCGSADIILVPSAWGGHGGPNNINAIATSLMTYEIDRYVCADCGYSEEWVRKEKLQDLKKRMEKHQK